MNEHEHGDETISHELLEEHILEANAAMESRLRDAFTSAIADVESGISDIEQKFTRAVNSLHRRTQALETDYRDLRHQQNVANEERIELRRLVEKQMLHDAKLDTVLQLLQMLKTDK